jgi:hypothetical protein
MRIPIAIMIILVGYIVSDLSDLAPSPDVPDGSGVTQDWYRKYLEGLELERLAEAQGESGNTTTC